MFLRKIFLLLIQLFACCILQAQLCKGSLGDPIVNITFGAGSNPGGPLSTTKNLQYLGYDCPNDGFYTITNSTSQCFGSTWHNLNSDHTGDANGYFMLVNASLQKSEFYIDTVKGLCPNTTYEYAAWIANVMVPSGCLGNPISPNLTFNIEKTDGSLLQTYSTGDIYAASFPQWKQYGFFFSTPLNASEVVVRITNNSAGGCGNDLAIDDITFRPCGALLTSYIAGEQSTTKELCIGDNAVVTLSCHVSAGYNTPSYQWQESKDNGINYTDIPGANDTTFITSITANTPSGKHLYRLNAGDGNNLNVKTCRIASNTLAIHINNKPVINAHSNSPVCEGRPVILSASEGLEYIWSGANNFSGSGASVTINDARLSAAGTYYVDITSLGGCRQQDSTTVSIITGPTAAVSFRSKNICGGDSVLLNSSGGTSYLWIPATGLSSAVIANPVAKPADTTQYTVIVKNLTQCTDSAIVTINVVSKPEAEAGPDKSILEGQSVTLSASVIGGNINYNWSPQTDINDVNIMQPVVNPVNDITYFLTATSNDNCGIDRDSVKIHVFKKVIIPNAFSPNGDGINDTWNIKALNAYTDYELSVFNRYGQIVFFTKDYSRQWEGSYNGKILPAGTYYYLINLKQGLPLLKGYVVILK